MWGVRTCGVVVGQLHMGFPGQERRGGGWEGGGVGYKEEEEKAGYEEKE